jgi:GDP-L-fucose synthase
MADACVHLMENVDFKDIISFENVISSGVEKPLQPTTSNQQPTTKQQPATNNQQPITNTHINIGTGKEISIKELAETIKKAVGFQGNLYFNADKPDGTLRKLTDSSKLENLGWKYKVELSQGIQQMYAWYCDTK